MAVGADSAPERFLRGLLGLGDVGLRVRWLDDFARTRAPEELAPVLEAVVAGSEVSEPRCREALMTIALWVAGGGFDLGALRAVAQNEGLLSLLRVIRRGTPASSAPGLSEPPVPDYGSGRELTLGERRSLARRSDRTHFDALLRDPHPMVIEQLLVNPKTTEHDVLRVVAYRPARAALIEAIARSPWLTRRKVRLGILFNPGAPQAVSIPLVGLCTRDELKKLARGADLPPVVRALAAELAQRRPPLFGATAREEREERGVH